MAPQDMETALASMHRFLNRLECTIVPSHPYGDAKHNDHARRHDTNRVQIVPQWKTLPNPPINSEAIQNAIAAQPKCHLPEAVIMTEAMTANTKAKHSRINPMFCIISS